MKLRINFAPRSDGSTPRPPRLRFGLGALLVASLVLAITGMSPDIDASLTPPPATGLAEEEIETINRAIDDLNFPWLPLLASLEKQVSGDTRLTRFEADASNIQISLQGEARDEKSVLDLPRRLRQQGPIGEVRLVSQSSALPGEGGEFPIRFALTLQLSNPPGGQP